MLFVHTVNLLFIPIDGVHTGLISNPCSNVILSHLAPIGKEGRGGNIQETSDNRSCRFSWRYRTITTTSSYSFLWACGCWVIVVILQRWSRTTKCRCKEVFGKKSGNSQRSVNVFIDSTKPDRWRGVIGARQWCEINFRYGFGIWRCNNNLYMGSSLNVWASTSSAIVPLSAACLRRGLSEVDMGIELNRRVRVIRNGSKHHNLLQLSLTTLNVLIKLQTALAMIPFRGFNPPTKSSGLNKTKIYSYI